jgi:hypothetical protein
MRDVGGPNRALKFSGAGERDLVIKLDEPTFVLAEAIEVSGWNAVDFHNWQKRLTNFSFGQKHRTGRWLYSIEDMIRLAIVARLADVMRPAFAVTVAESKFIGPRLREVCALDDEGNLKHRGYDGGDEPRYLVAFARPENVQFSTAMVKKSELFDRKSADGKRMLAGPLQQGCGSLQPPPVIVMFDDLAKTITLKAVGVFERDQATKELPL